MQLRRLSLLALVLLTCCQGYPRGAALCTRVPRYAKLAPSDLLVHNACVDVSAAPGFAAGAQLAQVVADAGMKVAAAARCEWQLVLTLAPPTELDDEAGAVWANGADSLERYAVQSAVVQGQAISTIYAASDRGAVYGVRAALGSLPTSAARTAANTFQTGALVDYPSFALRGIVESIYGKSYSVQERQTTFALMNCLGENVYVYGSKYADPYTHEKWAEPYADEEAEVLRGAVQAAADHLISFVWAVSPGWWGGDAYIPQSICYSCDADFERLKTKTAAMRSLGISRFALLLDDLAPSLPWPADRAKFSSLAAAHAFLMNRWDAYLIATGAREHLLVVGSKYTSDDSNAVSGQGWVGYNQNFGPALHAGILPFWTGPQVFSPSIAASDLAGIDRLFGQKVVLWDNWPRTVAALDSRAADLPSAAAGFISCPVINQDNDYPVAAFWQVLGTLGDYAWQPDRYDAAASWSRWNALLPSLLQ